MAPRYWRFQKCKCMLSKAIGKPNTGRSYGLRREFPGGKLSKTLGLHMWVSYAMGDGNNLHHLIFIPLY